MRGYLVDMASVGHTVVLIAEQVSGAMSGYIDIKLAMALEEDVQESLLDAFYEALGLYNGVEFTKVKLSVPEVYEANADIITVDEVSALELQQSAINLLKDAGFSGKFA